MISKDITFRVKANKSIDWDDIPGRVIKIQARKPEQLRDFIVNEVRKAVNEFDMAVEATFIAHHSNGSPAVIAYEDAPHSFYG